MTASRWKRSAAEPSRPDEAPQILLRRGDQLDVDRSIGHGAQPSDAVIVEGRQKLSLQHRRQCVDLVEEERAAGRGFEQSGLRPPGVGERPRLEAE